MRHRVVVVVVHSGLVTREILVKTRALLAGRPQHNVVPVLEARGRGPLRRIQHSLGPKPGCPSSLHTKEIDRPRERAAEDMQPQKRNSLSQEGPKVRARRPARGTMQKSARRLGGWQLLRMLRRLDQEEPARSGQD